MTSARPNPNDAHRTIRISVAGFRSFAETSTNTILYNHHHPTTCRPSSLLYVSPSFPAHECLHPPSPNAIHHPPHSRPTTANPYFLRLSSTVKVTSSVALPAQSQSSSSMARRLSSFVARPSTSPANSSAQSVCLAPVENDHRKSLEGMVTKLYKSMEADISSYSEVPGIHAQADQIQCHSWRYAYHTISPSSLMAGGLILQYKAERLTCLFSQVHGTTVHLPRCSGAPFVA